MMFSPISCSGRVLMDLMTIRGGESHFNNQMAKNELHDNSKDQLCYPCNKNLCLLVCSQFVLSGLVRISSY